MSAVCKMDRNDVSALLHSKKPIKSTHFSVICSNKIKGHAIIIGKKIEKLAVNRHKTKRRIFSILNTINSKNTGYIVFVKVKILSIPYKDIQTELLSLIMKNIN